MLNSVKRFGVAVLLMAVAAFCDPAEPKAPGSIIPVTVVGKIEPAVVKPGEPIPLVLTISNGLKGPIGYSSYSLVPNEWHGETVSISLVDINRNDELRGLYLARPQADPPVQISAVGGYRIEAGESLTLKTDAKKWRIVGDWVPGKYRLRARVESLTVEGNRCVLSVHTAPFEFEIR